MRILKYLFLLLLLSLVALSIFVATQKGVFTVERSKVINSPKSSIYNYVNDTKNWEEWNSLAVEDSLIKINPSKNTIGIGSSLSWEGKEGNGDQQTINLKENDSILQKMTFNGNSANVVMSFKDTLGGTKVSWKAKGEMGFLFKVLTAFNGGAGKVFGIFFEKSLDNLDKKLDYEINTYTVKVDGLVRKPQTFYLAQTFNSEFSKVNKNSGIVVSKITEFCKNNEITVSGKPFIIYHIYDTIKQVTKLSICIPIKDSIHISEGSDILSRILPSYQAVKTTLTGDYLHNKKALVKASQYLNAKHLIPDTAISHIEIYTIGRNEIKTPSKWITEIYSPIQQKTVPKPVVSTPVVPKSIRPVVKPTVIAPKSKTEKETPAGL